MRIVVYWRICWAIVDDRIVFNPPPPTQCRTKWSGQGGRVDWNTACTIHRWSYVMCERTHSSSIRAFILSSEDQNLAIFRLKFHYFCPWIWSIVFGGKVLVVFGRIGYWDLAIFRLKFHCWCLPTELERTIWRCDIGCFWELLIGKLDIFNLILVLNFAWGKTLGSGVYKFGETILIVFE